MVKYSYSGFSAAIIKGSGFTKLLPVLCLPYSLQYYCLSFCFKFRHAVFVNCCSTGEFTDYLAPAVNNTA